MLSKELTNETVIRGGRGAQVPLMRKMLLTGIAGDIGLDGRLVTMKRSQQHGRQNHRQEKDRKYASVL